MTKLLPDPAWLAGLRTAASQPPLRARVPLWAGQVVIGSVEPEFLNQIAFKPIQGLHSTLQKVEHDGAPGWRLTGDVTAGLDTLARETWEEAGLALDALQGVTHGGRVGIRRPSGEDEEPGYTVEGIDWYHCTVPEALAPVNQDGEVARFALLNQRELLCKMQQGEFTLEAALILAAWFESL